MCIRDRYLSYLMAIVTWFILEKTTFGLKIKAVGENPRATDSKGIRVAKTRYAADVYKRQGRSEGMDKASGRAMYAGDYREEGMLELALVRSPVSHGILEELDFAALPKERCIRDRPTASHWIRSPCW